MEIYRTSDYSIFKHYDLNRRVSRKSVATLKDSLKKLNLLMFKPIIVDSNFYIVDGQHRLAAAQELGIEVYYTILPPKINGEEAMIIFNQKQVEWKQTEFLNYHAGASGGGYAEMVEFMKKYGLSLTQAREIFPNRYIGSAQIRGGKTAFSKGKHADKIAEFLTSQEVTISGHSKIHFIRAVVDAHEMFSQEQLIKLKGRLIGLEEQATKEQYLRAFGILIKKRK